MGKVYGATLGGFSTLTVILLSLGENSKELMAERGERRQSRCKEIHRIGLVRINFYPNKGKAPPWCEKGKV